MTHAYRRDVGAGGRDPKNQNNLYHKSKNTKTKNLIRSGSKRLLHHYWYKVPVLHIVKYHFMRTQYWYFIGTNRTENGFETEKSEEWVSTVRIFTPAPHVSYRHDSICMSNSLLIYMTYRVVSICMI